MGYTFHGHVSIEPRTCRSRALDFTRRSLCLPSQCCKLKFSVLCTSLNASPRLDNTLFNVKWLMLSHVMKITLRRGWIKLPHSETLWRPTMTKNATAIYLLRVNFLLCILHCHIHVVCKAKILSHLFNFNRDTIRWLPTDLA